VALPLHLTVWLMTSLSRLMMWWMTSPRHLYSPATRSLRYQATGSGDSLDSMLQGVYLATRYARIAYMTHDAFQTVDALKAKLDSHRPLPAEAVRQLRADMVLRYTFHSNAIEGNTLSLMETKVVLEDGMTIGGKSVREHLEAINHAEAISFLETLVDAGAPLDERSLKELHQLVLRGISDSAGR
jgi:hypothetical protein